jgi:hypothetical protein
VLIISPVHNED